ncbi:MAG: MerR family transcriptional regulator [Bacteroidia bacterium]|nr:MerR family transcriptional regulator [Bacteroidia bacterium]
MDFQHGSHQEEVGRPRREFRRKEAEEITGIPARRIQFYSDNGLLHLAQASPGRGRERKYTKQNLLELLVIKELAKRKIELSEIKRIMVVLPGKGWPNFFDIRKFEREDPPGYQINIYDNGMVSYLGSKNADQHREKPYSDFTTLLIIRVNKLADLIKDL